MAKESVNIEGLKRNEVTFTVKGISPLIVNKFSEKAIQMILDKQMKRAKNAKEAKDPEECYLGSLYQFSDGVRTGFPAVGFKAAMVRAAKQLGYAMTDVRGLFFIKSDETDLIEIQGEHRMREDMVRIGMGTADVRFRAEYPEWKAQITILYNANSISVEQLAKLLEIAGFSCGIGEWRPEKSNTGSYGLFELVN